MRDVIDIAIDPNDEKHVMAASWYNGIWEIQNDTLINIFDSTNTNKYIYPFWGTYRVAGVEYDKSGNLLVASSLVDYCFSFLNYRGEWGGFNTTNFFTANDQIKGITEDKIRHYRLIYSINGKCIINWNIMLSVAKKKNMNVSSKEVIMRVRHFQSTKLSVLKLCIIWHNADA